MQLMLYHHLLSALVAPTFPFNEFWEKIHVDPFAQLSDVFLLQSGLARESGGGHPSCLNDLTDFWRTMVHSLHLRGLSPTLKIIYRTQTKRTTLNEDFAAANQEERDIARAIASSLRTDPYFERAIAASLREMESAALADDSQSSLDRTPAKTHVPWYAQEGSTGQWESESTGSTSPVEGPSAPRESSSPERHPPPLPGGSRIIGRKTFAFDEDAMNAHVQSVLQWWRGERAPRGVDVEHVRRCL